MHARASAAALALVLATLAGAPARAQCAYDQSSPSTGDVLRDAQAPMTIDFTVELELHEVRIYGEDRTEWPTDWARGAQEVRKTEFRPAKPLPPGRYMIEWNGYVRRHYHPDGGSITFVVAAAGDAPPVSPAAGAPKAGAPRTGRDSPYRALLGAGAPQQGR